MDSKKKKIIQTKTKLRGYFDALVSTLGPRLEKGKMREKRLNLKILLFGRD